MPKVSVIIPAYNAEKYIAETLDSVLNQTYSDFEVIVVDDGSKDDTVSIIKQYKDKYSEKVRLIQKENGGPASARNVGIKVATGEYIAFIDADDLWLPKKLEKQIRHFESQPTQVGLVYTYARKFDQDGIWVKMHSAKFKGNVYKKLLMANFIPNQSVMVRKKCFDYVGLFDESPEVFSSEDYDMWLRVARKFEISYLDEILSLYREHSEGINKRFERSHIAAIKVLEKHLNMSAGNIEIEETINNIYSQHLYDFGYLYLKEGMILSARQMFNRSLNIRFKLKTYLMKILTFIPFKILVILNKLLKSIFKPPEIVKSKKELEKLFSG